MSIMDCQSLRRKSNNLSNENINTGVSVVFKTKSELNVKTNSLSGNTSFLFSLLIIFDIIIGDPDLT